MNVSSKECCEGGVKRGVKRGVKPGGKMSYQDIRDVHFIQKSVGWTGAGYTISERFADTMHFAKKP